MNCFDSEEFVLKSLPKLNLISSIHLSELVVAVNEVLEHHSVSSGLRQRHRDSDSTRSGSRKSSRFRARAGFRSRKHLLLRKNR